MHRASPLSWWLLLAFFLSASHLLNVANTHDEADGDLTPKSHHTSVKEPHTQVRPHTMASSTRKGRNFGFPGEEGLSRKSRSLSIVALETLEDETTEEVIAEEDEDEEEQVAGLEEPEKETITMITESYDEFGTLPEDIPVPREQTKTTVSTPIAVSIKPPLSSPSPAPKAEDLKAKSPEPSTSVPESPKVEVSQASMPPEIEEKTMASLDEKPAMESSDFSSVPTSSASSPEPIEQEKGDTPSSPVPEEQPEFEEAMPSSVPETGLDMEEPSSSPGRETEKQLEIEEAPPSITAKEPADIDESVVSMEPQLESAIEETAPSTGSEDKLDVDDTPIFKLEEPVEREAAPSISPKESPDIEESAPSTEPDIEESSPSIEPTSSSDIETFIPTGTPEETLIAEAMPVATPEEGPDMEEEPYSSMASEPSYSKHAGEPLGQRPFHESPAPAPWAYEVKEATFIKPFKADIDSRRPPETLEFPERLGLRRTMLPVSPKEMHSQHRHPVPPEPKSCCCQSTPATKSEPSRVKEPQKTLPQEAVPLSPSSNDTLYALYYSPIGQCSQICAQAGESYQERAITCKNFAGIPVPLKECQLPSNFQKQFYARCTTHVCGPRHYIVLYEWSTCPQKCATVLDNGTVVPNQRFRDYECRKVDDGSLAPRQECDLFVQDLAIPLKSDCHSIPCERYGYRTSDWSPCNCRSWKQHRQLQCRRSSTGEDVDVAICKAHGLIPPRTEQYCYPVNCIRPTRRLLEEKNDHCRFTRCSSDERPPLITDPVCAAKGNCSGGRCRCEDGFEGEDCQMDKRPSSACPLPALLDGNGGCCMSGVFDLDGRCCQEHEGVVEVDIDGHCCSRPLDACGRCQEKPHYLDAAMQCCEVLDAAGMCCASGVIDECGVCDGLGRSCDTVISITIAPEALNNVDSCATQLRAVVEDALDAKHIAMNVHKKGTPHFSFSKTHVSMTSGFISFKLEEAMARTGLNRLCQVDTVNVEKLPVCGNGFCEITELQSCPQDCGYEMKMCPVQWEQGRLSTCHGHGQCLFVNASRCECHTGYEGIDCRDCRPGFFHVGEDSRCIPTEAVINRPTVVTQDDVHSLSGDHSTKHEASHRDASHDGWRYWPLYVYFILLLFCLIVFLIRRRERQKDENETSQLPRSFPTVDPVFDPAWTSVKDRRRSRSFRLSWG